MLLEKRHTEWVNLWNANCDSAHPRSKREVLQDLDLWERSQGSLAPVSARPGHDVMKKDFDRPGWAADHHDDFRALIANARQKMGNAKAAEPSDGDAQLGENDPPTGNGEGNKGEQSRSSDDTRKRRPRQNNPGAASDLDVDVEEIADDDFPSPQHTPGARDSRDRTADPPPLQPRFISPSPKKPRMFEDVDDPIVDSDNRLGR